MNVQNLALFLVLPLLSLAAVMAFVRLARGPSLPDRVVALDLLSTLAIGIIAVCAIITDRPVVLDVAIVLGLLAFLGTVAFARYLEKRV